MRKKWRVCICVIYLHEGMQHTVYSSHVCGPFCCELHIVNRFSQNALPPCLVHKQPVCGSNRPVAAVLKRETAKVCVESTRSSMVGGTSC